MNCPQCERIMEGPEPKCKYCGFDLNSAAWVQVARVYPPHDLVIESLLTSYGIPHKMLRRDIPQMPVNVGPLAEVRVMVPQQVQAEAETLLKELDDQSE